MFNKFFTALAVAWCLSGTTAAAVEVNLLCVGNSISEGAGLADPKRDAPPVKLAALIGNEPGIEGVHLINGGRSGSTTTDWLPSARNLYPWFTAMADTLVANHPDAVTVFSISLGTNDSACDRCKGAPASRETFRSNLRTIIDSLLTRYPGSLAVVHAPIWYSPNTYNGARYLVEGQRRLLPYRHEIKRLTEEYSAAMPGRVWLGDTLGYNYFKEKHLTDMQPENGHAGVFYLHPNKKGGTALASLWHKPVMAALRPATAAGKGGTFGALLCYTEHGPKLPVKEITVGGDIDPYFVLDMHGPVFESALSAYRVYFNDMQTVDIYSKRRPGLELATTRFHPTDSMLAAGFGDDCLMVRSTCGAGTLRGWDGTKMLPIGPVASRTARLVSSDNAMTVAEIEVKGWRYRDAELDAVFRYTIMAGHREARVDVLFNRPLEAGETFAVGIEKMPGDRQFISRETGVAASWGADHPQPDASRYPKERVALGLKVLPEYIKGVPSDPENLIFEVGAPGKTAIHYIITYSSEKETYGYSSWEEWLEYLKTISL